MRRTTISLPDNLAAALNREARRRGVAVSRVAREAIEARLGLTTAAPRKLPFAALGRSGHRSTARNIEGILENEWAIDRDR
jgi:predicted transcriptional regulator